MATFFHGTPEIQHDGLQTLHLMNPSYVGYSDAGPAAPNHTNMVFLSSPLNSINSIPQQQPQQQHFVGIPLQPSSQDPNRPQPIQTDPSSIHHGHGLSPRLHYNLWTPTPRSTNPASVGDVQMGPRRPSIMSPVQQQGLSLSLSPHQTTPFASYSSAEDQMAVASAAAAASGGSDEAKMVGLQSVLMGSKYLKAAQQLLGEVVNVGKGGRSEAAAAAASAKGNESSSKSAAAAMKSGKDLEGEGDGSGKKAADLSTAERQELQMKKAKLVNMLDEVEQRYRQYQQQMQIVVSSFEAAAGFGSARIYTALALQTISKQFRCLRDAISGQIRETSKRLGEEDWLGTGGSKSVGSRLRFVDHHLRQQRALQQLGMIQHNAWRPQRGLPERAVSVLRAWLFEHFLHPYPKDSDKHILAKQTGLTRSQVSNWFINARVRLWKPMVEEMYMEETKEQEQNNNGGGDDNKTSKSEASEQSASKSTSQQANSSTPSRTEQTTDNNLNVVDPKPPRIMPAHTSDLGIFDSTNRRSSDELTMQQRLKKARNDESLHHQSTIQSQMGMGMKTDELSNRELLMKFMDHQGAAAGFGGYPMGEIGWFDHEQFAPRFAGNGVSLTLGLPHCETLSLSGTQQPSYLSSASMNPLGRKLELSSEENMNYFSLNSNNGNNNASASHAPNGYESINIQNRKRFAAQLLPDFVS